MWGHCKSEAQKASAKAMGDAKPHLRLIRGDAAGGQGGSVGLGLVAFEHIDALGQV